MDKKLTVNEALQLTDQLIQREMIRTGKTYKEVSQEFREKLKAKLAQKQIKPDWITSEQWSTVPSVGWWENNKKCSQSIAQSKPATPEEAQTQFSRLRNEKNWNQGA